MKYITLTRGKQAVVDDEDYEELSQYKWSCTAKGYASRNSTGANRQTIRMHRQIMNTPSDMETDHINGDKLDNRKSNLRVCSKSQNQMNRRPQGGTSLYKGVYWNKKNRRWRAQIQVKKVTLYLGEYLSEYDAADAYSKAALEHFGEFARTN